MHKVVRNRNTPYSNLTREERLIAKKARKQANKARNERHGLDLNPEGDIEMEPTESIANLLMKQNLVNQALRSLLNHLEKVRNQSVVTVGMTIERIKI